MENAFILFLNAYSALIQALATVVLVILTVYYVRQVRRSASELARARKSEFLPILSVHLETREARTVDIYLTNIGRGLAQQPRVVLPFEEEKQAGEVVQPEQENVLVTFENVGIPEILELPESERNIIVSYGDIFGRTIITRAHLRPEEAADGEPAKETVALADWEVVLPELE